MRMLLPSVELRRRIRKLLGTFYNDCQYPDFNATLRLLAEFYKVPRTGGRVVRVPRQPEDARPDLDEGANGTLELSHPENRVGIFLHEFYHVLHFVEEETKADRYAGQFVAGL